MNWKQFLKPDWKKIILWTLLCMIFLLITSPYSGSAKGFPINYYSPGGGRCFFVDPAMSCYDIPPSFTVASFIIDVIFWYLISCLLVWIYAKIRKK